MMTLVIVDFTVKHLDGGFLKICMFLNVKKQYLKSGFLA